MAATDYELSPVKFSRLTTRGIILGLSLPQVIALATGAVVFIAALYAGGPAALYTAPAYLTLAALAVVGVGGRKLIEWVPITGHWVWRKAARQTTYRRRIVKPRPTGTLALPGDAAQGLYHVPEWGCTENGAGFAEAMGGDVMDDETAATILGVDLSYLTID